MQKRGAARELRRIEPLRHTAWSRSTAGAPKACCIRQSCLIRLLFVGRPPAILVFTQPFYSTNSSSSSTTDVQFNELGNMTVTFSSAPNVPVVIGVIGVILEPVAEYVGQDAARGVTQHLTALRKG